MIDQKKRAYHFETSSLLPLKLVLIEAEKESPPHVRKEQKDMNEELALELIASMKKKYRKSMSLREALFATTLAPGVICLANHAGEQSPNKEEIASGRCPRNDINLEP